ncbi:MAG: 1-deoxy-D-xylulose-5-phosphate reductoisomerase [Candidatus Eisenbacteria bacterium]|nr:1-deoxy-D-xylulose-5-phosphate reductoisomerase [Candidatus Eisenbacteria bacterium]
MKPARIVLLGSTGSIGKNVLRVVDEFPDRFLIVALAAGSDVESLAEQIARYRPERAALAREEDALRAASRTGAPVFAGEAGLLELVERTRGEILVNAIVGAAGLRPTLAAIGRFRRIALANKESLVAAGEIVMRRAREAGTEILPIDSEHAALHQCLAGRGTGGVRRIVLTASGGPFRGLGADELDRVRVEDALAHPTWVMGKKITIDSATLMNKGLEVIEAMHLFGIPPDRIDVVVHPQSVIHSLVEFEDGSYLAELGETDMRRSIRYALSFPERLPVRSAYDLTAQKPLTFERPDRERFPCLRLAYEAARRGGTAPTVLNAANEIAVETFLSRAIGFREIPAVIEETMKRVPAREAPDEEDVFQADAAARGAARAFLEPRVSPGRAEPDGQARSSTC